jgi:tRNA (guanine37-N1)-methyltransferase
MQMKIDIITLFPDMFAGPFDMSMLWKAKERGLVEINLLDLREYGIGPRRTVDDTPYGGGDGMLLRCEPLAEAIDVARSKNPGAPVIIMSPQGKRYNQQKAQKLATLPGLILIAGHYEGFDERIVELADEELSVGDYVLTGGELPAMVIVDSITRLLPGVLGGEASADVESFSDGLLEYPQYTRPVEFRGMKVPEVLQNGNHAEIEKWRRAAALDKTKRNRPDLLDK